MSWAYSMLRLLLKQKIFLPPSWMSKLGREWSGMWYCVPMLQMNLLPIFTKCWSPSTKINDFISCTTAILIPTSMRTSKSHNLILAMLKNTHPFLWQEFYPWPWAFMTKPTVIYDLFFPNFLVFYNEFLYKSVTPAALYLYHIQSLVWNKLLNKKWELDFYLSLDLWVYVQLLMFCEAVLCTFMGLVLKV